MTTVSIELGDIIKINAPSYSDIHNKIFLINYLDNDILEIIHDSTLEKKTIPLNNGHIRDESIQSISILNKAPEKGYCKQNGLLPEKWIDIYFGGNIPSVFTGKISSLEKDMIEIETFPEKIKIYIDFAYQGLPKIPPIQKIILRDKPAQLLEEDEKDGIEEKEAENLIVQRKKILNEEDGIVFDTDVTGTFTQFVDVPDDEKRYSIDFQTNELLDELLTIAKTPSDIKNVYKQVEYYKQLRTLFSTFDDHGNITAFSSTDKQPLLNALFKKDVPFMMPIVHQRTKLYDINDDDIDDDDDYTPSHLIENITQIIDTQNEWRENTHSENKFKIFNNQMKLLTKPFDPPLYRTDDTYYTELKGDIHATVDNMGEYNATTLHGKGDNMQLIDTRFLTNMYLKGESIYVHGFLMKPFKTYQQQILDIVQHTPYYINKTANIHYHDESTEPEYLYNNIYRDISINNRESFLKIIPTSQTIFLSIRKDMKYSMSLLDVIYYLETFMTHDITYPLYLQINTHIKQNIENIKKKLKENQKKWLNHLQHTYHNIFDKSILHNLYNLEQNYKIQNLFSSEILSNIHLQDNGKLFYNTLALQMIDLYSLENIEEELTKKIQEKPTSDQNNCKDIIIAKKYIDVTELNEDNNQEIFFDKKYDPTRYELLEELDTSTIEENLKVYLIEHLITTVGLLPKYAEEEAISLINGKKKVQDGHYALIENEGQLFYYKRENDKWQPDESITNTPPSMFCNTKKNCLLVKGECTDIKSNFSVHQQLTKILDHFEEKFKSNRETISQFLEEKQEKYTQHLNKLSIIHKYNELKYDRQKKQISYELKDIDIQVSPHSLLRDQILGQTNFVKKQEDILTFVNNYCYLPTEDPYWYYCTESKTKLLPSFYKILSNAFHNGTYQKELENMCRLRGELSDDGDAIIDKHSGYIIRMINFSTTEQFDEAGFKIVTHAVLSKTILDFKPVEQQIKSYKVKDAQMISNVIHTFGELMGFQIEEDFIVRKVVEIVKKELPNKSKYEAIRRKKPKLQSYKDLHDYILLLFTICFIIIEVQTSDIVVKKTYPGCRRSFNGWPLGKDNSTIKYFACVVKHLKSSTPPWNTIGKKKIEEKISKKVRTFMEKKVLSDPDVLSKLQTKRDRGDVHKELIPEEHDITKWSTFLPPLTLHDLPPVRNIASTFEASLKQNIQNGNFKQFEQLAVLRGKILHFSLSIQDLIQKTIDKESPVLITSGDEPFLENICCNTDMNNALHYFTKKQPTISNYNDYVEHLSQLLKSPKTTTFVNIADTKPPKIPIISQFHEEIIYSAYIKFCRFNSGLPTPSHLQGICEDNTSTFSLLDSLEDKIKKLKDEGRMFNAEGLNHLLQQVSTILGQPPIYSKTKHPVDTFVESLPQKIDLDKWRDDKRSMQLVSDIKPATEQKPLLPEEIMDNLQKYIKHKKDADIRNFILAESEKLREKIIADIDESISSSEHRKIKLFLETLTKWKERGDELYMDKEKETAYTVIKFLQNAIKNIGQFYPSYLNNEVNYKNISTTRKIPKHWKLSSSHQGHVQKIIDSEYDKFISAKLEPVYFDMNIPCMMGKGIFNVIVTQDLYEYIFLCTIYSHIESPALIQILLMLINKKKQLDKNNREIEEHILMAREKEKGLITSNLQKLTIEQREIENVMKIHRLGKWGVGQTKALFVYDREQYDREIKEMERISLLEAQVQNMDGVTAMNREIYRDNLEHDHVMQQRENDEFKNDMEALLEDS